MRHTNPYRPPDPGDAQAQLSAQVFARRVASGSSSTTTGTTGFIAAALAPGSPAPGDRWFDLTLGILFTYVNDGNSSQWVEM